MIDIATVSIVGDNPAFRGHVERLAQSAGLASEHYDTLDGFREASSPDGASCVVLDIARVEQGHDVDQATIDTGEVVPVVVVSENGDVATSVWAMKSGAVDFLSRPFGDAEMLAAIHSALDCSSSTRSFATETERVRVLYARLSRREKQIMQLVTTGLMNKQIAWHLGLSEVTVKIHRKSVVRKTGANSLADLVRMADILGIHESGSRIEIAKAAVASTLWIRTARVPALAVECRP